jgi:hypothetical protein
VRSSFRKPLTSLLFSLLSGACLSWQTEPISAQDRAVRIAAVIADPQIFETTPATVVQKFSELVEVTSLTPTKYLWQFKGTNPELGIQWAQVEFQPAERTDKEEWQLLQIQLAVSPATEAYPNLYRALNDEITKRVGKSVFHGSRTSSGGQFWRVAKHREITLREGMFENPLKMNEEHVILLEAAILQGEKE